MPTVNDFKRFLIEEIKAKTFAHYKDVYDEVNEFSKTKSFMMAYEKWKKISRFNPKEKPSLVKHIMDRLK